MDDEVAESLAGVVRLLRRAAHLAWQRAAVDGLGSSGQVLALGIDLVADEAARLLLPAYAAEGPPPAGHDPARLLQSAERLLARLTAGASRPGLHGLRCEVADLVWEANTSAGA